MDDERFGAAVGLTEEGRVLDLTGEERTVSGCVSRERLLRGKL